MRVKTLVELEEIKKRFIQEKGINSAVGIGKDDKGSYRFYVYLFDESRKEDIPSSYDGVTVVVIVTGPAVAL